MNRTCVNSLVNLEVLRPGKHLATARIRTGERFFSGVDADVVDEFVLGFEGQVETFTASPVARVIGLLRAADMVDRQMSD